MSDARTHWYLDQTAQPFCGHGEQPVYTDGRNRYVHCPVCHVQWWIETITLKPYEENLLQHGVVR